MPELPEVETIRRSLEHRLCGVGIREAEVLLARQIKWPDVPGFVARVNGRCILRLQRRGKYLLLVLDDGSYIVIHLRMTGRLLYAAKEAVQDSYVRIVFHLENGDALYYADTRTLGAVYAMKPDELWRIRGLAEMGPEPLTAEFSADYLQGVLAGKKMKIKSFLLNQKWIGGLGNIYADEALFLAGILPMREAGSLSGMESQKLYEAVNRVIADGISEGGTTFRDYIDGDGKKGLHQENLFVYHRTGKACRNCGDSIVRTVVGGRGTHYCPHCQK